MLLCARALFYAPFAISVASGGGKAESPPPQIGKIVVENWCYFPEVYTFKEKAEIPEIFSKNYEKVSIPNKFR